MLSSVLHSESRELASDELSKSRSLYLLRYGAGCGSPRPERS